jgi:hypothetical protein
MSNIFTVVALAILIANCFIIFLLSKIVNHLISVEDQIQDIVEDKINQLDHRHVLMTKLDEVQNARFSSFTTKRG